MSSDHKISKCTATVTPSSSSSPVKLFYVDGTPNTSADEVKGTILLIHGFPQTSHQFRHAIPLLVQAGYRVIAPDYRGAGYSGRPTSGFNPGEAYTKKIVAEDLHELLQTHLGIKDPVHVVGHDIGGMIAHAYAAMYPKDIASLIWGECPIPGSSYYEENKGSVKLFHFVFHSLPDLPEALVAGRESIYLRHFFDKLAFNPSFMSQEDLAFYVMQFSQPGAITAGMDLYRAFEMDAYHNRTWRRENGKTKVPTLCLMGRASPLQEGSESMNDEFYEGASVATVPYAGHWLAEENPQGFADAVLTFVGKHA